MASIKVHSRGSMGCARSLVSQLVSVSLDRSEKSPLPRVALIVFQSPSHFQPFPHFFFVLRTLAHVGSLASSQKIYIFMNHSFVLSTRIELTSESFVVWQRATSFSNSSTTTIGFVLRKLLTRRGEEISLNFN